METEWKCTAYYKVSDPVQFNVHADDPLSAWFRAIEQAYFPPVEGVADRLIRLDVSR